MPSKLLVSCGETRAETRPRLGLKPEPVGIDAALNSGDAGAKVVGKDG